MQVTTRSVLEKALWSSLCLVAVVGFSASLCAGKSREVSDVKGVFQGRYRAWREYCRQKAIFFRSDVPARLRCSNEKDPMFRYCQEIVELGPSVVPYVIEEMRKGVERRDLMADLLQIVVQRVTRVNLHVVRGEEIKTGEWIWVLEGFPRFEEKQPCARSKLWLRWWEEGRKQTPERFENLCKEWKALRGEGKEEEAWEKYQRIRDLGIVALPFIMEKVEAGERWLIPALSYLTDNAVKPYAEPDECAAWWKQNRADWTIPEQATPEAEGK